MASMHASRVSAITPRVTPPSDLRLADAGDDAAFFEAVRHRHAGLNTGAYASPCSAELHLHRHLDRDLIRLAANHVCHQAQVGLLIERTMAITYGTSMPGDHGRSLIVYV